MKNYLHAGDTMSLIAPYAVAPGAGMLVGSLFAVASASAIAGVTVEGKTRGVFSFPKFAGEAWAQGAKVYWDDANKRFTTTAAGNTLQGCASIAALAADVLGYVRLNGIVS